MKIFRFLTFAFIITTFISCFSTAKDVKSDAKPFPHDTFDTLLKKHVNNEGWVDYEGFIADSTQFNKYLNLLSANHPNEKNWSENERLAYWINAYNAFTIQLIIDNYPVASIKDIKNGIPFVSTVWDIAFIKIEGIEYDLNNIEHNIIRQKFDEPRIHAAVICASRSCPQLRNEAFTADRLDDQLEDEMRRFVNEPTRNKIDSANKAELSKIFTWYKGDFTKNGSLIDFINKFSTNKLNSNAEIEFLDYGWGLNVQDWEEKRVMLEKASAERNEK